METFGKQKRGKEVGQTIYLGKGGKTRARAGADNIIIIVKIRCGSFYYLNKLKWVSGGTLATGKLGHWDQILLSAAKATSATPPCTLFVRAICSMALVAFPICTAENASEWCKTVVKGMKLIFIRLRRWLYCRRCITTPYYALLLRITTTHYGGALPSSIMGTPCSILSELAYL